MDQDGSGWIRMDQVEFRGGKTLACGIVATFVLHQARESLVEVGVSKVPRWCRSHV